MPVSRFVTAIALAAAVLWQQPSDLTPAGLALLGTDLEAASQVVERALEDEDPIVRAVAARLAAVNGDGRLTDRILALWDREQNAAAAAEQARALLMQAGPATIGPIEKRLETAGRQTVVVLAEWLATNQPDALADRASKLASLLGDRTDLLNPAIITAVEHASANERLLEQWLALSTGTVWRGLMDHLVLDRLSGPELSVLAGASGSPDDSIREATVWSILVRLARDQPVPAVLIDAALPLPAQPDNTAFTWETFGREIIARRRGGHQVIDGAAVVSAEAGVRVHDALDLARIRDLTKPESSALKAALGELFPSSPKHFVHWDRSQANTAMRTVPPLWPGFLAALMEAANCKPRGYQPIGAVGMTYHPNGRVSKAVVNKTGVPQECLHVMAALGRLSVPDVWYRPRAGTEWLLLPFDREFVACADAAAKEPSLGRAGGLRGRVTPPRKVRDARPEYPETAQAKGIQGVVVLEGVMSTTGCVSTLQVLRSVVPALDVAALRAVASWKYKPAELDGRPVPIIMEITVNFALR